MLFAQYRPLATAKVEAVKVKRVRMVHVEEGHEGEGHEGEGHVKCTKMRMTRVTTLTRPI